MLRTIQQPMMNWLRMGTAVGLYSLDIAAEMRLQAILSINIACLFWAFSSSATLSNFLELREHSLNWPHDIHIQRALKTLISYLVYSGSSM